MRRVWSSRSAAETRALGARLGAALQGGEVVLLCGDLGVGKTQFAQGVARALGVAGPVVSPTFTLAVHYAGRLPLVHYDLYRVARATELDAIGFLEADDARTVSLVEWGDRVTVPAAIRVTFTMRDDGTRDLVVDGLEPGAVA